MDLLRFGIGVYAKALSTSLVRENVDQFVPLVLAKAGYEKRNLKGEPLCSFVLPLLTLQSFRRPGWFRSIGRDVGRWLVHCPQWCVFLMIIINRIIQFIVVTMLASKEGDPRLRLEKFLAGIVSSSWD
jgi:hypothetical protein